MQVLLEINEDKALSILEVLKNIKGVTVKSVNKSRDKYIAEFKEAFLQTEQDEKGEIKLKSFDELIDEL